MLRMTTRAYDCMALILLMNRAIRPGFTFHAISPYNNRGHAWTTSSSSTPTVVGAASSRFLAPCSSSRTRLLDGSDSSCSSSRTRLLDGSDSSRPTATETATSVPWKGASHSKNCSFVIHVVIDDSEPITVSNAVDRELRQLRLQQQQSSSSSTGGNETRMSAGELVQFGSIWYLPVTAARQLGVKPTRVQQDDFLLQRGDYLRLHHHPRRFPAVYKYDWSLHTTTTTTVDPAAAPVDDGDQDRRRVVVDYDMSQGWMVLNKPMNVPVHMTVDNQLENVVACLKQSNPALLPYVGIPQRLDSNTSGLLVVATTPSFAGYAAQLLRNKTAFQLNPGTTTTSSQPCSKIENQQERGGIHKIYRCLVCLMMQPSEDDHPRPTTTTIPATDSTEATEMAEALRSLAASGSIMRHYLEPSLYAPKRFVVEPPSQDWPECLLKIRRASRTVFALHGDDAASQRLAQALWPVPGQQPQQPERVAAVLELEIELLTGRTHQIRGQLSAYGCPVVGDVPYGGATPVPDPQIPGRTVDSERLALQCCELEFLDPNTVTYSNGTTVMKPSDRWNKFRLDEAWWTPHLKQYEEETRSDPRSGYDDDADDDIVTNAATTTSLSSSKAGFSTTSVTRAIRPPRPELLPPQVQLSSGKHKYVLLRATHDTDDIGT